MHKQAHASSLNNVFTTALHTLCALIYNVSAIILAGAEFEILTLAEWRMKKMFNKKGEKTLK